VPPLLLFVVECRLLSPLLFNALLPETRVADSR
jgi:hypothetical protein